MEIAKPLRISVCIPTYQRPGFLAEAVRSCLKQTRLPDEILIGDDSLDEESKKVIENLRTTTRVPLKYFHRIPPLKQHGNVHDLFQRASGDLVCLLHDDDLLDERAFEMLAPCFEKEEVVLAYGKLLCIGHTGNPDSVGSERLNRDYFRTPDYTGVQRDALTMAMSQQVPPDGFLIRSSIAKCVGYIFEERVGDACDFLFFVKVAQTHGKFEYVDFAASAYRMTEVSVSRGRQADTAFCAFAYVISHQSFFSSPVFRDRTLRRMAPVAIGQAADLGERWTGLKWYFSRWHGPFMFTLGGAKRLLKLLMPRSLGTTLRVFR